MGWPVDLLEAASDMEITHEEVSGLMTGVFESAIQGMVALGIVTMFVRGFYDILGGKHAKKEKEVLEMAEEIW